MKHTRTCDFCAERFDSDATPAREALSIEEFDGYCGVPSPDDYWMTDYGDYYNRKMALSLCDEHLPTGHWEQLRFYYDNARRRVSAYDRWYVTAESPGHPDAARAHETIRREKFSKEMLKCAEVIEAAIHGTGPK